MGQSRKSQDAVEAIRLQDRVIEKSIRPPPVERFGPPVPFFSSNCFLSIRFRWIQVRGARGLRDESNLRRQQSASAATQELLREGSPKRQRVSFLAARGRYVEEMEVASNIVDRPI